MRSGLKIYQNLIVTPKNGILLIDKEKDVSSFQVVKSVMRILNVKKAGHGGTLDPFATGLLIILLGQGTKLHPFLLEYRKTYQATIRLGIETDTGDPYGNIIKKTDVPSLNMDSLNRVLDKFRGKITQQVPPYSAVKNNGIPLYKLARKGIKPTAKKKKVTIHSIKMISMELPDLEIEVTCSSGTYIRTLASDIGKAIGNCAHVKSLKRISIGPFHVNDAIRSEEIKNMDKDKLHKRIIPLAHALPWHETLDIDVQMAQMVRQGLQPILKKPYYSINNGDNIKLLNNDDLVAIGKVEELRSGEGFSIKILRVFNQDNNTEY